MVLDSAANFVRETTTESVDSTETAITVSDASAFVDPAAAGETDYNVVMWDAANHPRPDQDSSVEIMRVTAIDTGTNTLTVTRGQEGTSGASHPNGAAVAMMPTAGNLFDATVVSANYTTAGEDVINVDESGGAVTVTLATADTFAGNEIEVVNLTGTNTVTVNTEGAETIDGGSSVSITKPGWNHSFVAESGSAWSSGLGIEDPVAYPDSALVSGSESAAYGQGADAQGTEATAIGKGANASSNFGPTAVGSDAFAAAAATVVGGAATALGSDATILGRNSSGFGRSTVLGKGITNVSSDSVAIGEGAAVSTEDIARIDASQLIFGGTRDTIADADLNNGELLVELDETNNAFRLRGKDSGGTVREATVAW